MKKICNPDYEYHIFLSGRHIRSGCDHKHRVVDGILQEAEILTIGEKFEIIKYLDKEVPSCLKN